MIARRFRLALPAIALSLAATGQITIPPVARAAEASSASAGLFPIVSDDWQSLRSRFSNLATVLRSAGGVLEADIGLIRALLTDVRAFNDANPDHRSALALELQLARWVSDDTQRIADLYSALARLTDDNAELALSAFRYRVQNNLIAAEDRLAATQELLARFPGNRDVLREAVRGFQDALMYPQIIELLADADLNPSADFQLIMQHAEALFAEHEFERSIAVAQSIDRSSGTGPALQRQADALIEDAGKYLGHWTQEQALRSAEAAADNLPRVVIETSRGSITLELFENEAPNTVANFISLAESGFYAGTRFHRFVTNMMVQGGDPESKQGPGVAMGTGGPGYTIADEHGTPEARMHFNDSVAMAKGTPPDTAGSQFYLTHRPLPWLNDRHTVFGRVLEGKSVVRALRQDDEIHAVIVLRKRDRAYEPEVIRPEADMMPGG